ncbi:DMT family transporter [Tellurirhabdus rosea]|uniref:DMT family transporter n=1 Tax=Tellurirhabdus rosea TaxID=2674997 RepID=UPI0022551BB2|nr:DMT family transporter [Tellurirhabdus rosea]
MLYYFLAFLTGIANSTQSGVNSQLRQGLANPILAAVCSFGIGFLTLIGIQLVIGQPAPPLEVIRQISWYKWIGGLLGAFYVTTVILTVPRIGAASLLSLSIAGQLLAAVLYDHYGLLGFAVHPANGWRILGVILMIVGVVMVVKN